MVRNWLISLAYWTIAWVTYPFILAIWALGRYKPPIKLYKLLYRLEGQRIVKCRKCGFGVRWGWNFCPGCGDSVQETLVPEISKYLTCHFPGGDKL